MTAPKPTLTAPVVVLDTNTTLDWLVFSDARVQPLARAIEDGRAQWIACPAMRAELARMLAHRRLAQWHPDGERALSSFDRCAKSCAAPTAGWQPRLRCSDADDQVFIDLALAEGARWLVTRDRALLKLARRAQPLGLGIVTPADWALRA